MRRAFSGERRWRAWSLAAVPLYAVCSVFAEGGLGTQRPWGDVGQYERYGRLVLDGRIPYHDFYLEYPPAALPAFIAPALLTHGHAHYLWVFKLVMALVGLAILALMAWVLVAVGAGAPRLALALATFAASPALLGHVFLNRYDLWPALLTILALASLLARRELTAAGLLAVNFAAKVFAVALIPIFAVRLRRTGRRLLPAACVYALVSLLIFSFFLVVAFGGLGNTYYTQSKRALQIESEGATPFLVADQLGFYNAHPTSQSPGSIDLGGALPNAIGVLTTLVQIAAILFIAAVYRQGRETRPRLVTAFAAAVAAFAVFGKVLSPQYLVWLLPLVPLVAGRRGRAATGCLVLALVLTQIELHGYAGFSIAGWAVWVLVARNALLVVLFALLVGELREGGRSSAGTPTVST